MLIGNVLEGRLARNALRPDPRRVLFLFYIFTFGIAHIALAYRDEMMCIIFHPYRLEGTDLIQP